MVSLFNINFCSGPFSRRLSSAIPCSLTKSNSKIPKYDSSNLSENQITQYVGQIEAVIQSKGLYKKADFSLKELSSLTGINSSYLSQCINSRLETNFTDYVNSFRVDLAKQLLADPLFDKFKIEAIAFEAGFNSKVILLSCVSKSYWSDPCTIQEESLSEIVSIDQLTHI